MDEFNDVFMVVPEMKSNDLELMGSFFVVGLSNEQKGQLKEEKGEGIGEFLLQCYFEAFMYRIEEEDL